MSREQTFISPAIAEYIRQVSLREPEPLAKLRAEQHPRISMETSPEQGQLLHLLAHLAGARRALEIGIFRGYSSAWVALALPAGGKLIGCDNNDEYLARARQTWRECGVEDKIEARLGPALATLDQLIASSQSGAFDLAYIDADKENYLNYYERCLKLLRPGGLIAVDNVLWEGAVLDRNDITPDTEAIRSFNRFLHVDRRVAISMLTIGDGLTLACKL
jgi:predicted O-methyltransferase YrrM